MLVKISKIKGLGVFDNYTWDNEVPAFQRYNVIYGDNGSGKTTISRLMSSLECGSHPEYPDLEYKIECSNGQAVHGSACEYKFRVFNADYVQQNIGQVEGGLKHILVIGEENKALVEELEKLQHEYSSRLKVIAASSKKFSAFETARGKIFTAIAKTISEATSGSSVRNYRKNNAESTFSNLKTSVVLDEDDLKKARITIHQEVMGSLTLQELPYMYIESEQYDPIRAGQVLAKALRGECEKSVIVSTIDALKSNIEVSNWIEEGLSLHNDDPKGNCKFCNQKIPHVRWEALSSHFSAEDQYLKQSIEELVIYYNKLKKTISSIEVPSQFEVYADLREDYNLAYADWKTSVEFIISTIDNGIEFLEEKLLKRNEAISHSYDLDLSNLDDAYSALKAVIDGHNKKTASFDSEKSRARIAIESHYLCGIRGEIDALNDKIAEEKSIIKAANDGGTAKDNLSLVEIETSINDRKSAISNAHKAGYKLTQLLHTFLGRKELVFKSGDEGYKVLRDGRVARRLSEGEQTAIAFIYFIVQLQDRDFNLQEGIVVIDDPVSSLDAGAVYQAFAFLKNSVKDARQVFLLTHNFGFLRLLINWLQNLPRQERKAQYYMLLCKSEAAGRCSIINKLDSCLVAHPTEYHYLFKVLHNFKGDGTIASCYHIPNVTRKVLETFLDFYDPDKKSLYQKLSAAEFDDNKKTSIYKFANDLSHFTGQGFEPGLVAESQKNASYLLEMIENLAPRHYQGMIDAANG